MLVASTPISFGINELLSYYNSSVYTRSRKDLWFDMLVWVA
jgi:hypothetical protein